MVRVPWVHSFSACAKFEKLTFLAPLMLVRNVSIDGVRNVSISENFTYVLNEGILFQKQNLD